MSKKTVTVTMDEIVEQSATWAIDKVRDNAKKLALAQFGAQCRFGDLEFNLSQFQKERMEKYLAPKIEPILDSFDIPALLGPKVRSQIKQHIKKVCAEYTSTRMRELVEETVDSMMLEILNEEMERQRPAMVAKVKKCLEEGFRVDVEKEVR